MSRPSRTRSTPRRALYAAIVAIAMLGAAEIVLRLPGVEARLSVPDATYGIRPGTPLLRRSGERWVLSPGGDRSFNPVSIAVDRRAVDFRVVCLGGSSTFGYPYGDAVSFCHYVGNRMRHVLGEGARVEAVNLGGMSYGSHRVAGLVDTVLELEPDAVIVYSGHNEFVETAMVERVLAPPSGMRLPPPLAHARLVSWLSYGLDLLRPVARRGATGSAELFGFSVARSEGRIFTLEEKARVAEVFEERYRTILERLGSRGATVVAATMPSSLRDWKPDRLTFAYPLEPADRQRFLTQLAAGVRLLDLGEPAEAAAALAEAEHIDERHAFTAYLHGRALLAAGRAAEARVHLERARDLDPIPIRTTSAINAAIRRASGLSGVALVDAELELARASPERIVGREMILDYCHPTAAGHRLIAERVAERLVDLPALRERAVRSLESYVPTDESEPAPRDRSPATLWWLGVVAERQDRLDEARHFFELGLERDPRHVPLLRQLAQLDQRQGRMEEAGELLRRLAGGPGAAPADRLALAAHEVSRGRVAAARPLLDRLAAERPGDARVWLARGRLERAAGNPARARLDLERALSLEPGLYPAHLELGATCRALPDRDCAVAAYRTALGLVRYSPEALRALEELDAPPS